MASGLFEFLFGRSEHLDVLVFLEGVQFGPRWFLLEERFLSHHFTCVHSHSLEVFVLQYSNYLQTYSAAVGLFREEYFSMDSMRSMASIEASGRSSARLSPFSSAKKYPLA